MKKWFAVAVGTAFWASALPAQSEDTIVTSATPLTVAQAAPAQTRDQQKIDQLKGAEKTGQRDDTPTMTAAQLSLEVMKIQDKRASLAKEQSVLNSLPAQAPGNPWASQARIGQQSYVHDHEELSAPNFSPYRSQSVAKPFSDVQVGPKMQYYIGPYGGMGMSFSPSSW